MCPETSSTSHWGHSRSKGAPRARGTAGLPLKLLESAGEGHAAGDAFPQAVECISCGLAHAVPGSRSVCSQRPRSGEYCGPPRALQACFLARKGLQIGEGGCAGASARAHWGYHADLDRYMTFMWVQSTRLGPRQRQLARLADLRAHASRAPAGFPGPPHPQDTSGSCACLPWLFTILVLFLRRSTMARKTSFGSAWRRRHSTPPAPPPPQYTPRALPGPPCR